MNFHLEFPISPFPEKLNYSGKLLFTGSCFAENIGKKLQEAKFNTLINPNGILYNPLSLAVSLNRYIKHDLLKENELFFANECWNSWEHHSRFSHPDKNNCLQEINRSITDAHFHLKESEWLFITFGSAFSYSLNEGNIPVANCHKVPQKEFTKSLLNVDEIITTYDALFSDLKKLNPGSNIVLTVSPVRYIRDGVVENNLSKSILIQSVHRLVEKHDHVFYFPAYELVIDDLRDYRFFNSDLVHPNEQAIDYVFDKLMETSFTEETKSLYKKILEIRNAMEHRPFNENAASHMKFKSTYEERCIQLKKEFNYLDLEQELIYFRSR